MALVLADRIKESTTVTSTGPATLLGASVGFKSFSDGVGDTNTTYYCIADQTGANWEVGLGTYSTTGPTLTRTTIFSSSNAGSAVNFGAGTKDVFVTIPAEKGVWVDVAGTTGQVLTTSTTGSAPTWATPGANVGFQRTVSTITPTAGTTVFTVTYTVGYIDVFQNGVKLVIADDFVATNGTSVTLSVATLTGDLIEFVTYLSFSGQPGYTAPRSTTITSSATPSINTDTTDMFGITAQAVAITGVTVTGTPVNGQKLWVYITGTAAQYITWGTSFESSTASLLPVTTVLTNRLDVGFIWNIATSKWRCMASA